MTLDKNGEIPKGVLVTKASGRDANGYWEFQFTEATWARWLKAKAYAEKHFGSTLYIRSGWNVYRPLHIQWEARRRAVASGNPLGAAYPGSSSHGGNWRERDCLAIDVDPNGLTWAQVWEACRHAGFECGLITEQMSGIRGGEPWHIIDFNAFAPAPASTNKPLTKETKVKHYHRQDAAARSKNGRTVAKGQAFHLNTALGAAASHATNIVGKVGAYSITLHVYAQGTPGDALDVVLLWDDTRTSGAHSAHYVEHMVFDKDGFIRGNVEFKRGVAAGNAVYARISAPASNKGTAKVTVFDADSYLFLTA